MPNDINELDANDIGLKSVMGARFQDDTLNEPVTAEYETITDKVSPARKGRAADSMPIWSPFNAEPSFTQKLMNCAKWASLFSALYALFFYWECTGQMQPSASVPSMTACAAMVGWSFGKYAFRGNKK